MTAIITNPKLGVTMSQLEVQARKGCPFAQEELQKQALKAASLNKQAQKAGLNRTEFHREFLTKRNNGVH